MKLQLIIYIYIYIYNIYVYIYINFLFSGIQNHVKTITNLVLCWIYSAAISIYKKW